MSTVAAPTPDDRAMVRRFGFLGLPGERVGGALSFSGLRAELGDDNAASLVMRLGVLIKVHHLDQLGVSLDRAVDHILQSLTPDERRSIAAGNAVPPRVEALISAEADAAKLQKRAENIHGPTATDAIGIGLGLRGSWLGKQGILAGGDGGTSARFDSINGGPPADGNWASPTGQAYMRSYAMEHGLSWAADNPGLLRLGPAAIQTLADAKLRKDVYDRMVKEASFAPQDVVTTSKWALKNGRDANEVNSTIADVNRGLNPQMMREHNTKLMKFFLAPQEKRDEALKGVDESHHKILRENPTKLDDVNRERGVLGKRRCSFKNQSQQIRQTIRPLTLYSAPHRVVRSRRPRPHPSGLRSKRRAKRQRRSRQSSSVTC